MLRNSLAEPMRDAKSHLAWSLGSRTLDCFLRRSTCYARICARLEGRRCRRLWPSRGDDEFAIKHHKGVLQRSSYRSHVAFNASENDAARHFHATALIHGADDEGAPGHCPEYGEGYFAAFVRDLDGYRLEAKVLPNNL